MEGFLFFLNFFQVYEAYKMAPPSSKFARLSKSQATTANSACTVAFFDLLRSSAAKLAHLSLHYSIQYYLTSCFISSFSSVMF